LSPGAIHWLIVYKSVADTQSMSFSKFQEAVQVTIIDDRSGGQSGDTAP
jgi:hypothetical protein